jgi:two-component system chemotaxis response regulator CheB
MINALIVDDSATARLVIRQTLESDREIRVVGEAENGAHALNLIKRYKPDIVTMDVYLRRENGIEVTSSIMATSPRPILIVTGINPSDPKLMYRAIEAGALDVAAKPLGPLSRNHERDRAHLLRLVKTLARVPVVHRFSANRSVLEKNRSITFPTTESIADRRPMVAQPRRKNLPTSSQVRKASEVVLIGASTGGPKVVSELLSEIPRPFPLPIVVIQHISSGFSRGFAEWIHSVSGHRTAVVDRSMRIRPGEVYFAPDDTHLRFVSARDIAPSITKQNSLHVPSYDVLLESATMYKISALAIVMTGMGSDGTWGLKEARDTVTMTVAQTPKTCVVDGMPGSAIEANLIDKILDPHEIAALLRSFN